jgi:PIN domain nuclease of toxin-antitoxin system
MGSGRSVSPLNLDTHIVLFLLAGTLTDKEIETLRGRTLGISDIVLWEIAKLEQLGRISRGLEDPAVQELIRSFIVWPIDSRVALQSTRLDFAGDPADEIIAATSIVYGAPLVTRDDRIRASKRVPVA